MADVTGPISTLSGATYDTPDGMKCDQHPDRDAVIRIQGETDSMGCEMHDLCQECLDADRAWRKSPEADEWRTGQCEWCKEPATDLRDARDYEEGSSGRVYRICGACKKRDNEYWAAEARAYDDDRYDDNDDDYCDHGDYHTDILTGRATCNYCDHRWYLTSEQIKRDQELEAEYQIRCEEWNAEAETEKTADPTSSMAPQQRDAEGTG